MQIGLTLFVIFGIIRVNHSGQTCLSCTDVESRFICQHVITCDDSEVCFTQKHTTESGRTLYDQGCANETFCRHGVGAVFGRSSEGYHVVCTSCCNNTRMCNMNLQC